VTMLARSFEWVLKGLGIAVAAVVIGAGACFVSGLAGRPICGCFLTDIGQSHFATYEELRDSGIGPESFPEIVPRATRDISLAWSIDHPAQDVAFSLSPEQLRHYELSLVPERPLTPLVVSCLRWWPDALRPRYINLQDTEAG
jgi:hypothetical protein